MSSPQAADRPITLHEFEQKFNSIYCSKFYPSKSSPLLKDAIDFFKIEFRTIYGGRKKLEEAGLRFSQHHLALKNAVNIYTIISSSGDCDK